MDAWDVCHHQVKVPPYSTALWSGYLYDGLNGTSGCSPQITVANPNNTYRVYIRSKGLVQGNYIASQDDGQGGAQVEFYTSTVVQGFSNSAAVNATVPVALPTGIYGDVFYVLMASSYGLYRHSGGLSGRNFKFRVFDPAAGSDLGSRYTFGEVYIKRAQANRKFVITHELGHNISDWVAGGTYTGSYDYVPISFHCGDEEGYHHKIDSIENIEVAFAEGFAHFYSVDIWNSHYEENCTFRYYASTVWVCKDEDEIEQRLSTVDCEGGADNSKPNRTTAVSGAQCDDVGTTTVPPFPQAYLETNCTDDPLSGKGTELDWMRQFWDMHADTVTSVSMNSILSWIDTSFDWPNYGHYYELDSRANAIGGTLNDKWDSHKYYNGIVH